MSYWQNFYHDATAEQLDEAADLILCERRYRLGIAHEDVYFPPNSSCFGDVRK